MWPEWGEDWWWPVWGLLFVWLRAFKQVPLNIMEGFFSEMFPITFECYKLINGALEEVMPVCRCRLAKVQSSQCRDDNLTKWRSRNDGEGHRGGLSLGWASFQVLYILVKPRAVVQSTWLRCLFFTREEKAQRDKLFDIITEVVSSRLHFTAAHTFTARAGKNCR